MSSTRTVRPAPSDGLLEDLAPVLRVLGHADRLRIVSMLQRERRIAVGDIARRLGLAPNAVSQHLGIMLAHGIVSRERDGRRVHYAVVHPAAVSLLECMRRQLAGGEA